MPIPSRNTLLPAHDRGRRDAGFTVAVVDPVPLYREGLCGLVCRTAGMRWAWQAAAPDGVLRSAEGAPADVVLLSSEVDPRAYLVEILAKSGRGTVVVLLIAPPQRTRAFLTEAFAAGARGAVPRNADSLRVVDAILKARAGRHVDAELAGLAGPEADPGAGARQVSLPVPRRPPLSRREFQVLQLIADGLGNARIGEELFVSVETVRTHVRAILRKMSARDRTHAVSLAFRSGILALHQPATPAPHPVPEAS